jgi:hypothetical protein
MMAIAVCASSSSMLVHAQAPTSGHTATLVDSTVFIHGGLGADGNPTNAAYSIRLGEGGAFKGSNVLDITKLAGFSTRALHSSVLSNQAMMVNCGGFDAVPATAHKMSCDIFNPIKYTSTTMNMTAFLVNSRGGMAVAVSPDKAFYFGGSLTSATGAPGGFSTDTNLIKLDAGLGWRSDIAMPVATRYHTATWIQSIKSFVILGGQIEAGTAVAMNVATTFSGVTWSTRYTLVFFLNSVTSVLPCFCLCLLTVAQLSLLTLGNNPI